MKPLSQFRVRWAGSGREHISEFAAASESDARRAIDAYKIPGIRVVSVERLGLAAPTNEVPEHVTGLREACAPQPEFSDSWNASLDVICRPVDTLDAVQRPAALVFEYYGRVMNGGHYLHFDVHGDSRDPQLLQALRDVGAARHARILSECYFLRREAKRSQGEGDYASEAIHDLDLQFYRLKPEIPELLARYFEAHPENFHK